MSDEKSASIEKAACGRARADDQLKQFIEHKKREIKKLETLLDTVDWDNLTQEQEFGMHGVVDDIIKANQPQHRFY